MFNIYDLKVKDSSNILKDIELFNLNTKYLLNIEQENFTIIEKIVYELVLFHIEKLELKISDIYIEFYIENLISSKMNNDYYKNEFNETFSPIVSTITYLNNNNITDLFTNIEMESYKFKNFNKNNILGFSFPKFLKHISFEGSKYFHGIYNLFNELQERITLKVNIWTKKINVNFYENKIGKSNFLNKNDNIVFITEKNNKCIIDNVESLNEEMLENILYKNYINFEGEILENLLKKYNDNDIIIFENKVINLNKDIYKQQKIINISSKKFLQRFIFKNFYDKFICNFIVNEMISSFNNIINYNNHEIIDIEINPRIMNLILTSFQLIIENIKKSYCLKNNNSYNINKIFILKNNISVLNNFFNDNSSITINIILNSKYEGGSLMFDDDLENNLEMGDMIIFSGETNHKYLPIINGSQYILVGLINICE